MSISTEIQIDYVCGGRRKVGGDHEFCILNHQLFKLHQCPLDCTAGMRFVAGGLSNGRTCNAARKETLLMLVALSAAVALIILGAVIGFLIAIIGKRFLPETHGMSSASDDSSEQVQLPDQNELARRISTLYELTSHVGTQVNQHSVRVSEITDSIERPKDFGAKLALVAGKLLLTANEKLQADLEEAKQEIQIQKDQLAFCMQEARTDKLTCLPNRRALDHELVRFFAQYRRDAARFSLLVIDIDHFKRVNDQYGHMVGDQILKSFSRCLMNTFRESDFVARYGGEEFLAILPKTPLDEACKAAERIRMAIAASPHKAGDLELRITASIGVKEVASGETEKELIQKADKALYAAKHGGRNCCYYHEGEACSPCAPVAVSLELAS